jgi:hypothetical protein
MVTPAGNRAVYVPGSVDGLGALRRTPYLHFIVEATEAASEHLPALEQALQKQAARYPEIQFGMLTLANFDSTDVTERPMALADVFARSPSASRAMLEGGF